MIQADHWVLEIVCHGYSSVAPDPSVRRGKEYSASTSWTIILSEEVEDLLRKGVLIPVPLDPEKSGFYSTYFLVPK